MLTSGALSVAESGLLSGAASPDPTAKSKEPEFEPIQITIEYDLRNPKDGIHVVKPSDLYPNVCTVTNTLSLGADSFALNVQSAFRTALLQVIRSTLQGAGCRAWTACGRDAHGSWYSACPEF